MCDRAWGIIKLQWGRAWYDAILFISGLVGVQLPVIKRGKQQLFAGVKVVPPEKVITLSTLRKNRVCSSGQDTTHSWLERSLTAWSDQIHQCSDSQPVGYLYPRGYFCSCQGGTWRVDLNKKKRKLWKKLELEFNSIHIEPNVTSEHLLSLRGNDN